MADTIICPKCSKTVRAMNCCENCGFALTDTGKIIKSTRETDEEKKEKERIEEEQRKEAERNRQHELHKQEIDRRHERDIAAQKAADDRKKREEENRHKETMAAQEAAHQRKIIAEANRHKETIAAHEKRKKTIFLLTLIFLCVIGASIVIGLSIAKKHYDNLPYLNYSHYQIWKNPVLAKEYRYFLSETNYESKASSLQNYVKHVTDEKMELVGFADYESMEDNSPVVYVSFMDAIEYCNFKSNDEGLKEYYTLHDDGEIAINEQANGYRLPTVEEWTASAKKFKELRDDKISEWCFDTYNNSEQFRIIKKYQKGIKAPAEYQSYSDATYGVDTIGFRVIRSQE